MEKELPNIPPREHGEHLPDRTKSGFLERWRKKVYSEPEHQPALPPEAVDVPTKPSKDQETVATFALKKIFAGEEARDESKKETTPQAPEVNPKVATGEAIEFQPEPALVAETEGLYASTKKIGNKVLRFATALLRETKDLPSQENTELADASHELDESRQHLDEELGELEAVHSAGDVTQQLEAAAPRPQITIERVEKKESKVPAFVVAQLAVLAIAGAGIFMATLDGEHRREHRILKTHRKKAKETISEQAEELQAQQRLIAKQQEALTTQSAQLQELQGRDIETIKRKERAAFVHQVSELTEHQAEITHEVTEKLQTGRQEAVERRSNNKTEVIVSTTAEAAESPQPTKTRDNAQKLGGTAGGGNHSPASLQNSATQLQKILQNPPGSGRQKTKQPPKDAWLYVAIITTLVIASIAWLVVQLVVS